MRKVVAITLLCLFVSLAAFGSNPYWQREIPDYHKLVVAYISSLPHDQRHTSITTADLHLLELWFSDSALFALYQAASASPITNWTDLHDLKYISVGGSGTPRSVCSEKKALQLMFLFDLSYSFQDGKAVWPWQ